MSTQNECPHCGNPMQSQENDQPCGLCGSRRTPFGYLYEHEYNQLKKDIAMVIVIAIICLIAVLAFLVIARASLLNVQSLPSVKGAVLL